MVETETGAALLALSPDDVFITRSVSEVIELHKKIQYEIERKREDLRAMVGERYRELIHAADTIGEMKATTEQTLEHLGATVTLCRNLHDTHLIGFRIQERISYDDRSDPKLAVHSVAVLVKVSLDLPEKVWSCIEQEQLPNATLLSILARHINAVLTLQAGSKHVAAAIALLRPLIDRQWASVSNLHEIIEQACRDKLQQVNLKEEVACSCLLSIHLLTPQSSLLHLLTTFIGLHSERGLERALHYTDQGAKEVGRSIVDSARLIMKTVELVHACFIESDGGSILRMLKELYRKDAPPLIDLMQYQDKATLKLLPQVISTYRLTAKHEIKALTSAEVASAVVAWLASVRSCVQDRVTRLLHSVTNANTLHRIREEALQIETPSNWAEMCDSLSMPQIDVWSQYFQPLLTVRVKEIIDTKWRTALEAFKQQITADLLRVTEEGCEESEADLNWFVWRDLIGDSVIESREQVVDVMNSLMKGMWRQDRGFTPTLERMCAYIDGELLKLLADLERYLHEVKDPRGGAACLLEREEDGFADREELQVYLRDVTGRNIESMLQYIKDECFDNPSLQATDLKRQTTAVYTARFIQSLTHLMPGLRACYVPQNRYSHFCDMREDEAVRRWTEVCARLKESCLYCWGKWVDIAMTKAEELKAGLPQEFTTEANLEFLLVQWDVIQIEEKDEEGNSIESTIKIPSGPSLKLQEFLYAVSRILDQIIPHTLPAEVHASFVEKIADITLSHYDKVIRANEADINQRCALQLLMDVRHATLLLVPRENMRAVEMSQGICESLQKLIDPFDYDVFYVHIQTNVKRSVQRVQTVLGSMLGSAEQTARTLGARVITSGGSADRSPALLAAAPEPRDWFTLLPVTAPSPVVRSEKTRKKAPGGGGGGAGAAPSSMPKSTLTSAADITELMTSSLSGAKSGAAAFFGDWFSSS